MADLRSRPAPASLIRWRAPFSRKANSTHVRPNQMNRPNGEPEKAATAAKASGPEAAAATQPSSRIAPTLAAPMVTRNRIDATMVMCQRQISVKGDIGATCPLG
ncbi:hypothetical protein FQZ97_998780 [compost metagenome]